ncbi:hypothetical protein PIB30_075584 [Stylosanthes scabra]|uniref:Uncharacterized protein n=1 Tax=Stylosanthes scabra TaxID=79078 RepID=A0ABU6WRL3_9FABA|nr:hypothetical protein [Stylosanthes scabra]
MAYNSNDIPIHEEQNQGVTLGQYNQPTSEGCGSTILRPTIQANNFELTYGLGLSKPRLGQVWNLVQTWPCLLRGELGILVATSRLDHIWAWPNVTQMWLWCGVPSDFRNLDLKGNHNNLDYDSEPDRTLLRRRREARRARQVALE